VGGIKRQTVIHLTHGFRVIERNSLEVILGSELLGSEFEWVFECDVSDTLEFVFMVLVEGFLVVAVDSSVVNRGHF
jgi:hypothetical protein